ncbi:hypothetical protein ACFQZI_09315 [Mucilaginibacter lutimaris]|uniref:DUF4292 domain-containing protein n=1 Tax=Mucilaginibacter lutimaris TaxID=931629 RepID=A0ABW2ZG41_9SPHI
MNKLYIPLVFLAFFCLSSCVDIEEHYNFKPDGSCTVQYGFDMSRALSVLNVLISDSVRATPQFSLVKDTSMNYYNTLTDSVISKMSAEDIKTAKNSALHISMDLPKNKMRVNLDYSAKSPADLVYYLHHVSAFSVKLPEFEFLGPDKKDKVEFHDLNEKATVKPQDLKIDKEDYKNNLLLGGQDYYTYEITDHKFSRIINKIKFDKFLKGAGARLAMAKAMLIDMPYKMVLKFTKPVKKVDNRKAIVSADRMQVTLVTSMDEVIKNPALMNLQVDF